MAKNNLDLIKAFRKTIVKLKNGAPYQWGHMGACNCGNLAQEITQLSKAEIHRFAMQRMGDWNEQLIDYCPTSGYPMDLMIDKMLEAGLTLDELKHLERLSDPKILKEIPFEERNNLLKNRKEDVILYLETWTGILEKEWLDSQQIQLEIKNHFLPDQNPNGKKKALILV
ncbi:hypothetical protein P872_07820 [Rhodonellum psychrophilum GCM71 = DSM 17998]|uniref:Uncharacterized protein n=2 Tax=Rhodonellum TaxID=336827 RepID=U5BW80_9BACT|nr:MULTISPECIES: hypothetical protein [Rhodonellum]ERM81819.1 hypothetical protein P872_07820 [Rhodonellum psychrophilum GCM71 = DSM 17998]MDO9552838.1 hypothetical protein [Rhodonellum sp.]SDZ27813.1 hypothetical protein SAMN05444412_10937 [Rhodonellum ikkaensis]